MRLSRIMAISFLILLAAFGTGCLNKTWSYDFTDPSADISDWYYDDSDGVYDLDEYGLSMSHVAITTPVNFTGDFSVNVRFNLDVDLDSHARLIIAIEDDVLWSENHKIEADFWCLGDADWSEGWDFGEFTEEDDAFWQLYGPISGIEYDGENNMVLEKNGNTYTLSLNGRKLRSFDASYYDGTENFFSIWTGENGGEISILEVVIKHDGGISEEFPIRII